MVQFDTRTKKKINEIVKGCPLDMNRHNAFVDLNILTVGSIGVLMEWIG